MEMMQTLSHRQTLQMGGQMLHSLSILGMSSQDLAEHLAEAARSNPFVSYRPPPAFAPRAGVDFDAVAAVAAHRPSLMAHVADQIDLAFSTAADRLLALHFAEALEPTGWLGQPVEAIALAAGASLPRALSVLGCCRGSSPRGFLPATWPNACCCRRARPIS
ncbi:RNA polymerase sigma-54 factor [Frigidibacter mobilis]|uniref:RNA polymerase sigma-54 factor n=1 Tax=Frigidibacter mobilis TaxID=1335048 RepID=A0A159Z1K3_9RHOB|nr:hypothetical protein [Frigidibacter mobilis]AMY68817.1 RNA polymerase sigma-54 factor [Frigidibacter mobilis]